MSDLASARAHVVSVSNRAAAGVYEDTTGPRIVAALEEAGFGDRDARPSYRTVSRWQRR